MNEKMLKLLYTRPWTLGSDQSKINQSGKPSAAWAMIYLLSMATSLRNFKGNPFTRISYYVHTARFNWLVRPKMITLTTGQALLTTHLGV